MHEYDPLDQPGEERQVFYAPMAQRSDCFWLMLVGSSSLHAVHMAATPVGISTQVNWNINRARRWSDEAMLVDTVASGRCVNCLPNKVGCWLQRTVTGSAGAW